MSGRANSANSAHVTMYSVIYLLLELIGLILIIGGGGIIAYGINAGLQSKQWLDMYPALIGTLPLAVGMALFAGGETMRLFEHMAHTLERIEHHIKTKTNIK